MPEQLQVLDLALYPARHVAADKLAAIDRLHGNFLAGDLVLSQLHLSEGAFANVFDKAILIEAIHGSDGAGRFGGRCLTRQAYGGRGDRR